MHRNDNVQWRKPVERHFACERLSHARCCGGTETEHQYCQGTQAASSRRPLEASPALFNHAQGHSQVQIDVPLGAILRLQLSVRGFCSSFLAWGNLACMTWREACFDLPCLYLHKSLCTVSHAEVQCSRALSNKAGPASNLAVHDVIKLLKSVSGASAGQMVQCGARRGTRAMGI